MRDQEPGREIAPFLQHAGRRTEDDQVVRDDQPPHGAPARRHSPASRPGRSRLRSSPSVAATTGNARPAWYRIRAARPTARPATTAPPAPGKVRAQAASKSPVASRAVGHHGPAVDRQGRVKQNQRRPEWRPAEPDEHRRRQDRCEQVEHQSRRVHGAAPTHHQERHRHERTARMPCPDMQPADLQEVGQVRIARPLRRHAPRDQTSAWFTNPTSSSIPETGG